MAAYEFFLGTSSDTFIANIKTKAEAYGWIIDFFGLYLTHNRLHLHNADGSHFEIWYASASTVNIRGCTGYSSGDIPTSQPGVSGNCQIEAYFSHLIAIGPHSIFIKVFHAYSSYNGGQNVQFGSIVDKIGAWTGGTFISSTYAYVTGSYLWPLWAQNSSYSSQVYIDGSWSTLITTNAGAVYGICDSEIYTKMPFAYSGGMLPCPIMLVRINPTTASYRDPLGYAPDVRLFSGGTVYASLEEITIDGFKWIGLNQEEGGGVFAASPNLLVRLAA